MDYDEQLARYLAANAGRYSIAAPQGFWLPVWHDEELQWHPGFKTCPLRLRSPIGVSSDHVVDLALENGSRHTGTLDLSHHTGRDLHEDAAYVRGVIRFWLWLDGADTITRACGSGWVPLGLHDVMQHHGFSEQSTGGNCTAWERSRGKGVYTLITEAEAPHHPMDWLVQVTVGHYDADGDQIGELETGLTLAEYLANVALAPTPPGVQADLDLINRHRASIYQPPLDPVAAGWGPDDIRLEAERIRRIPNPLADAKARLLAW